MPISTSVFSDSLISKNIFVSSVREVRFQLGGGFLLPEADETELDLFTAPPPAGLDDVVAVLEALFTAPFTLASVED